MRSMIDCNECEYNMCEDCPAYNEDEDEND